MPEIHQDENSGSSSSSSDAEDEEDDEVKESEMLANRARVR